MTGMYNVLEKLRAGEPLTRQGARRSTSRGWSRCCGRSTTTWTRRCADAYGWPVDLADEEILERLVALNRERAEEERRGLVRWLRPEFQAPAEAKATQEEMTIPEPEAIAPTAGKRAWPKTLPEQVQAIRVALAARPTAVGAADLARDFRRARTDQVQQLLETLAALGHARRTPAGNYLSLPS